MPSKTTAGIVADLVRSCGGSSRFESFGAQAKIALQKAIDQAPFYNFYETRFQDLVGIVPATPFDSRRFAVSARDVLPLAPAKQRPPTNVATYDHVQLYGPNFDQLEAGVDVDGSANPLVTTLSFDLPIPGPVGPTVYSLTASGPLTAGTYTLTWNGHTTGAIAWNATLATINAALAAAAIPYTAYGGPLTTPWSLGFICSTPGASASFVATPTGITGGTLTVATLQVGSTPAAPARVVRFWFRCRAALPASETAIIPVEDIYLDLAPKMHMHGLLMTAGLGGDQTNHAYQEANLLKQLEAIKRRRVPIRVNTRVWRGNSSTGGRVRTARG